MIANLKCDICTESFDLKQANPRVCFKCGNSLCQTCLIGIYQKTNSYKCPYCKSQTQQIWPKNIGITNILEGETNCNLCVPHKKKAIALCAHSQCTLPIAICDAAQCSKMHKERGTNNIPLSLITERLESEYLEKISKRSVQILYQKIIEGFPKFIKQKAVVGKVDKLGNGSQLKKESNEIINKINSNSISTITSKQIALLKKDLLQEQMKEEIDLKQHNKKIIKQEKQKIIAQFTKFVQAIDLDLVPKLSEIMKRQSEIKIASEKKKSNVQLKPEFELIKQEIGQDFTPTLIFSSMTNNIGVFKQRIAGQANLVFRIQLADNTVFGVYLKKPYANNFSFDYYVVDPNAFVFWLNQKKIFKASIGSESQYDISPSYLLSVGNTYAYDGFWLKSDFKTINPTANRNQILSTQYHNLRIPIHNRNIKSVEVYQLDMLTVY